MAAAVEVARRLKQLVSQTDVDITDRFEYRELHHQLESGMQPRLVQHDTTLVHFACKYGWLDFLKYFIEEHSCDPHSVVAYEQQTPLHFACGYGHIDTVCYLIREQHCDPDCCDRRQQTPLLLICQWRMCSEEKALEIVIFLVATAKCDVNKRDVDGNTALLVACRRGDAKIARFLISEGHCDVTICSNSGDTALHAACSIIETADVAMLLLEETKIDLNAKNNDGDTPLHLACRVGNFEGVQPRCNPLEKNSRGDTALHEACRLHFTAGVLKLLLEKSMMDPHSKNNDGDTPLHLACRSGSTKAVQLLVREPRCNPLEKNSRGDTALHEACRLHFTAGVLKLLLEKSMMDPHSKNNDGDTPLHLACRSGSTKAVQLLVREPRCNPLEKNSRGDTALHEACRLQFTAGVLKLLLEETKMDPHSKNNDGDTPLHLACRRDHFEAVKLLVREPRCNPLEKNSRGDTALHEACRRLKFTAGILKLLLEKSMMDPHSKNNDGDTPLHLACRVKNLKAVQLLVREPRYNPLEKNSRGDTALHEACRTRQYFSDVSEIPRLILEETKIDPNAKNDDGETPLDLANEANTIRELIRHGANPQDVYKNHGKVLGKHSSKQPLRSPVKLFMVGNPSAGKSTLTKALKSEMTWFVRLVTRSKPVSGVDEKTAGIVPHEFESKTYGLVTLYDFAGQREFYGSHAALLQNAIQTSTPIFLLVVDLSESDEVIKRNIRYWLSFLENQCTSVSSKPHVIVIGSHTDILKSRGEDSKHKASIITSLLTAPQHSSLEFAGFVDMDCQYADSAGMRELHRVLRSSCDGVRTQTSINFFSHCFLVYLLDKFRDSTAVTFNKITATYPRDVFYSWSSDIAAFLPRTMEALEDACDQLNDSGHLLVLKNPTAIGNSYVIINRTALLAEVNGTIFAPEGFKEHIQLASSTGLVPLSNIAKHFTKHDLRMLVGFLSIMEFCCEIVDPEVLRQISHEQVYTASEAAGVKGERYFFFPGLVTLEAPSTVWEPQPQFDYHCGWILKCSQPEEFFDPRFLQVLLLRLAFSFAFAQEIADVRDDVPSIQRECSVWNNGIYWGNIHSVETLVEVTEQNRVVVLMRCPKVKPECLQLRSLLIQKVLAAAHEFCSKVSTVESFISPSEVTQFPLKPISQLTLFSIKKVSSVVAEGVVSGAVRTATGKPVSLDSLLSFEPYADLGEAILRELFDESGPNYKKKLSNLFIYKIAERISKKKEMVKELFKPNATQLAERMSNAAFVNDEHEIIRILDIWKDTNDRTYQCLREMLDQFSVFGGRNPLEIAGLSCKSASSQPQHTNTESGQAVGADSSCSHSTSRPDSPPEASAQTT